MKFEPFPKVPRYSREMIITEKIDGTNASIWVVDTRLEPLDTCESVPTFDGYALLVGSRKRFITPEQDNFSFARWAYENAEELVTGLGEGVHHGEWWGSGVQRGYGLEKGEKRFSLFNVGRWFDPNGKYSKTIGDRRSEVDRNPCPTCCTVVPLLARNTFNTQCVENVMFNMVSHGSWAAPGFMKPEGIMIYHTAANQIFKKTFEGDDHGKERS